MAYGPMQTWKIVYTPKILDNGRRGVALVEADCRSEAMFMFQKEYRGEYSFIDSCRKLNG